MVKKNGDRIWTRGFALAFITKLFSTCVFVIYTSTLILYMTAHYQASSGISGLAVGIFILFSMAGRILSAQLDEVFSRKSTLLVSTLLFFLLSAAYLIPVDIVLFIILRAAHGITFGLVNNVITVVATDMLPPERLGEGLGIYAISASLATTLGPLTGVVLMEIMGYQAVMWAGVVFAGISLLTVLGQRKDVINIMPSHQAKRDVSHKLSINDFLEKPAIPISAIVGVVCLCYAGSVTPYVAAYSGVIGLGAFSFLYFVTYTATLFAVRPVMGMLQDRKGSNAIMYPSLVCLVLGFLALAFIPSLLGILLAGILLGIGHGTAFSGGQTIAVRQSPINRVGFATSTYFAFADVGAGLGPAVLSVVFGYAGYSGMYLCAAVIGLLMIPCYAIVYQHGHA